MQLFPRSTAAWVRLLSLISPPLPILRRPPK